MRVMYNKRFAPFLELNESALMVAEKSYEKGANIGSIKQERF